MNKRKIIDIETLEVFPSMTDAAKRLGVTPVSIYKNILMGFKTKGIRLEFFDEWLFWTNSKKSKHTEKNNIYFI